jgi:hypothetical protein
VKRLRLSLKLDKEQTNKMPTSYLYRSEEHEGGRPIIDGLYVQRRTIGTKPPAEMSVVLEWDT